MFMLVVVAAAAILTVVSEEMLVRGVPHLGEAAAAVMPLLVEAPRQAAAQHRQAQVTPTIQQMQGMAPTAPKATTARFIIRGDFH
jgi:hypothetical protein